jgi:hypothetical protein
VINPVDDALGPGAGGLGRPARLGVQISIGALSVGAPGQGLFDQRIAQDGGGAVQLHKLLPAVKACLQLICDWVRHAGGYSLSINVEDSAWGQRDLRVQAVAANGEDVLGRWQAMR